MTDFSHVDKDGRASMVDVGDKKSQRRTARASGRIDLAATTVELIKENNMKKGDVLAVAELAGIQAAKRTSGLIPLCHPLRISNIQVKARLDAVGVMEREIRIGRQRSLPGSADRADHGIQLAADEVVFLGDLFN